MLETARPSLFTALLRSEPLTQPLNKSMRDHLLRIERDPRTPQLLRELCKSNRQVHVDAAGHDVFKQWRDNVGGDLDPSWSEKEIAAGLFLYTAVWWLEFDIDDRFQYLIETDAEYRERVERSELRQRVAMLRREAILANRERDKETAQTLECRADYLAMMLRRPAMLLQHKSRSDSRSDRRTRVYAILLATSTKQVYGQTLLGQVADMTNIALDLTGEQEIKRANVQNWTRPPRPQ
jgi:hypothetical protein